MNRSYLNIKNEVHRLTRKVPGFGITFERMLGNLKTAIKAGLLGGVLFEEIGFRYIGPVDGHNIAKLQRYLKMVRDYKEPVLFHVFTEKGRGYQPAVQDPTAYHAPGFGLRGLDFGHQDSDSGSGLQTSGFRLQEEASNTNPEARSPKPEAYSYTECARNAIYELMAEDPRVCVITAAMCQGNMLEVIRDMFPGRFFDVGICESHAVVFAAGLAKSGMRPIVDIYSTFMQRAYDHIFQEVSLQNLPVTLMLDRAGIVGPDGPTHNGVFDIAYLRPFPNLTIMAPGCASDMEAMLRFAISHDGPVAIRYPRTVAPTIKRKHQLVELAKAEIIRGGQGLTALPSDGMITVCGGQLADAIAASQILAERGINVGVINARFIKPLDTQTILEPLWQGGFLVTVEEGMLAGGFGSAVLEAAAKEHLDTRRLHRIGVPDMYVEHGERDELLAKLGIDLQGIVATCITAAGNEVRSVTP